MDNPTCCPTAVKWSARGVLRWRNPRWELACCFCWIPMPVTHCPWCGERLPTEPAVQFADDASVIEAGERIGKKHSKMMQRLAEGEVKQ